MPPPGERTAGGKEGTGYGAMPGLAGPLDAQAFKTGNGKTLFERHVDESLIPPGIIADLNTKHRGKQHLVKKYKKKAASKGVPRTAVLDKIPQNQHHSKWNDPDAEEWQLRHGYRLV